jgi:hypothetical protein
LLVKSYVADIRSVCNQDLFDPSESNEMPNRLYYDSQGRAEGRPCLMDLNFEFRDHPALTNKERISLKIRSIAVKTFGCMCVGVTTVIGFTAYLLFSRSILYGAARSILTLSLAERCKDVFKVGENLHNMSEYTRRDEMLSTLWDFRKCSLWSWHHRIYDDTENIKDMMMWCYFI